MIQSQKPEMICLQETKMEVIEGPLCEYLWENSELGWCCKSPNGLSSVLLTMWDKSKFELSDWSEEFGGMGFS
ncbi:hypothetical protein VNO78_17929 [Psophocarpus tetragonolobus]|uniref:Uncharacterized protein n=1 Tax=Psophocarpus tetragonolobus TaxID=3891 RepID=A0AAN9SIX2_PSOTE